MVFEVGVLPRLGSGPRRLASWIGGPVQPA
jgi:hypothetical protein